jgi:LysR family carnitine catabolism transcriptional activator
MDRRQLEYFLAVAAHGSFTSAAHSVGVTQPSLSHTILSLERELGTTLFHRLGRGVTLTTAGEALLEPARQVLRQFAMAYALVRNVGDLAAGRLDIVAVTTLAVDPLARLVGLFRRSYPAIDVTITDPEHATAVAEMVRTGQCELGMADFSVPVEGLRALEFPEQEVLAVLPPGSVLPLNGSLDAEEVVAMDLIATPLGTTTRTLVEHALNASGVSIRVAVETSHRAAIVPLVLHGAGVALLPRPMAEDAERQGAVIAPLTPPVLRRVRLLWRRGPLSPAANAFIDLASSESPCTGPIDDAYGSG